MNSLGILEEFFKKFQSGEIDNYLIFGSCLFPGSKLAQDKKS